MKCTSYTFIAIHQLKNEALHLNSVASKCISVCFRYDECKWMHFWDTPEVLSYAYMPKRPYGDTPQHHQVEYGRAANGLQCAPRGKSDSFIRHLVGQTNCVLSSGDIYPTHTHSHTHTKQSNNTVRGTQLYRNGQTQLLLEPGVLQGLSKFISLECETCKR